MDWWFELRSVHLLALQYIKFAICSGDLKLTNRSISAIAHSIRTKTIVLGSYTAV